MNSCCHRPTNGGGWGSFHMLNRAQAEVQNPDEDNLTQEQARELAAQERQHDEHIKESMLNRAKSK